MFVFLLQLAKSKSKSVTSKSSMGNSCLKHDYGQKLIISNRS